MPLLYGAYGLCMQDPPAGPSWWNEAPPHWQEWCFEWSEGSQASLEQPVPERTVRWDYGEGTASYNRDERRTVFISERRPSPHAMVHPNFVQSALLYALSRGWQVFHSGSFVANGVVWALLGDKEMGKSSALAWLHERGFRIFADDVLALDGPTAIAGPRSLDLRESAQRHFGFGVDVGVVGTRRRWRVRLPPVAPELPFGGWIVLRWSDGTPQVARASVSESLASIGRGTAVAVPLEPRRLLDLAARPVFVFERPRDWSEQSRAMEMLVEALPREGW